MNQSNNHEELNALIKDEIKNSGGAIHFARYMELALYAPLLGYYSNGSEKWGTRGDYITAPLISPLFSQCLAKQIQEILKQINEGDILEFGAGSGDMACDILLYLEAHHCLPDNYFILELSAELLERQRKTLQSRCPHLVKRVTWLTQLPAPGFRGIMLANEICDAMPVHRFSSVNNKMLENYVTLHEDKYSWITGEISNPLLNEKIRRLKKNYFPDKTHFETEINANIYPWIQSLSDCLQQGLILLIDYGYPEHEYYHPDRSMGTLMCHYQHRSHTDPLIHTGRQDITAHVNFTEIANAAIDANLDVMAYSSQGAFLLSCGLLDLVPEEEHARIHANQAIKQLTLPHEMGELFKVIALGRDIDIPLLGFTLQDLRARL